jgi:hypothetical protein
MRMKTSFFSKRYENERGSGVNLVRVPLREVGAKSGLLLLFSVPFQPLIVSPSIWPAVVSQ